MKSRKLISLFCAAAMSVSAFAGFTVTASAADTTTLWSDSFDGYENIVAHQTNSDVGNVLLDGTSTAKSEYAGIDGIMLYTTNRADDSSYWQITEDEGEGGALTTNVSRFSNADRGAELAFNETYAPDGTDLVLAFKVNVANAGETTFDAAIELNSSDDYEIDFVDDLGITLGTWTDVKIIVTSSGTSVYAGDSDAAALTFAELKNISSISFNGLVDGYNDSSNSGSQKATSHPFGYPQISFDNMVVYTTAEGEGLTAETPTAATHGTAAITYETVPAGEAPEDMGLIASDNFNDEETKRVIFTGQDATGTDDDGNDVIEQEYDAITIKVGTNNDTRSSSNWSIAGNAKTDPTLGTEKYLAANNGQGSEGGRGPKFTFNRGDLDERETVVAYFATKLTAGESAPAEVVFSGDFVVGTKYNLSSPLAMITTDATANSSVYDVDNPLTKVADGGTNVLEVEEGEWLLVKIEAYRSEGKTAGAKISVIQNAGTDDETETYIYGSADEYTTLQDYKKSGINHLPYVSFRSGNSDTYSYSNSINYIDNVAVYSSDAETVTETATPEPVATVEMTVTENDDNTATVSMTSDMDTDAVLIQAEYTESGALNGVKVLKELTLTEGVAATETLTDLVQNDKIMLWNSLKKMQPLADAYTVTGGAAQSTDEPPATEEATPTATADAGGNDDDDTSSATATPTVTPDEDDDTSSATATPTVTPDEDDDTSSATATPTAVPTYNVTGTVENISTLTLTDGEDVTVEATIADGTATFTGIPAGEYTLVAENEIGYPTITGDDAKVTVSTANVESAFTVKAARLATIKSYTFEDDVMPDTTENSSKASFAINSDNNNIETNVNGTKVLAYTAGSSAGSSPYGYAQLDFSSLVANATAVTYEYDTYVPDGSRANISLYDSSARTDIAYTSTGVPDGGLFITQGETGSSQKYVINGAQVNSSTLVCDDDWLHTVVDLDYAAQTMSYKVTTSKGTVVKEERDIAYYNSDAQYADGIEFRNWVNSAVSLIDNINIYGTTSTSQEITIKYVDADLGAEIKDATTDTAVTSLPYTVSDDCKETFELNGYRYTYTTTGSTDSIKAVSADDCTITLNFTKEAYQTVTFTATLSETPISGVDIAVAGTPTDSTASAVDKTITTDNEGTATIDLLPGSYTYSMAAGTYEAIDATSFTVSSSAVSIPIALTANTAAAATLSIVYNDGENDVYTVEVYGDGDGKYSGDTVEASELAEYLVTQKVAIEESNLKKVYTYVSGGTSDIELNDGANTVTVTVKYEGDYYFWQDFDAETPGTTTAFLSTANDSTSTIVEDGEDGYKIGWSTTKSNGSRESNMAITSSADSSELYKVSFEWTVGSALRATGIQLVSVADQSSNVIFGIEANGQAENSDGSTDNLYLYYGGTMATNGSVDTGMEVPTASDGSYSFTTTPLTITSGYSVTAGTVLDVVAYVDYVNSKVLVEIYASDGEMIASGSSAISDATNKIGYISVGSARIGGDSSYNSTISNIYLDNIKVTDGKSLAEEAND